MFSSKEIRNIEFEEVKRGYNQTDVKAFLRKIAEQIEELEQEKASFESERVALVNEKTAAEQKMVILADKIDDYRKDEDSLRAALLSAQRLSDTIIKEANENAEIILNDARKKAEEMSGDTAKRIKSEHETLDKLKAEVSKFKNTVLNVYKSHLEILSMIPENDDKDSSETEQHDPAEIEFTAQADTQADTAVVFKSDEAPEEAPVAPVLEVSANDNLWKPEPVIAETPETAFYAPPAASQAANDPFASFAPIPELEPDIIDRYTGGIEVPGSVAAGPSDAAAPSPEPENNEPSRFGQLDFGDGFSFTTK